MISDEETEDAIGRYTGSVKELLAANEKLRRQNALLRVVRDAGVCLAAWNCQGGPYLPQEAVAEFERFDRLVAATRPIIDE